MRQRAGFAWADGVVVFGDGVGDRVLVESGFWG